MVGILRSREKLQAFKHSRLQEVHKGEIVVSIFIELKRIRRGRRS